jgi:hypothetical protein
MPLVAICADHKVLMKIDDNISLTVCDAQGILDQQLRPHPIHLLNIIIIFMNYLN